MNKLFKPIIFLIMCLITFCTPSVQIVSASELHSVASPLFIPPKRVWMVEIDNNSPEPYKFFSKEYYGNLYEGYLEFKGVLDSNYAYEGYLYLQGSHIPVPLVIINELEQ